MRCVALLIIPLLGCSPKVVVDCRPDNPLADENPGDLNNASARTSKEFTGRIESVQGESRKITQHLVSFMT